MSKKMIATCVLALSVGCATAAVSPERSAATGGAIRAAEEMGAAKVPEAALHLQLAKEQEAQAMKLLNNGEKKRGEVLLMRAQSDAEVALAMAREPSVKADAQQALERLKSLEEQAPRRNP
jgi:hypothetical protein